MRFSTHPFLATALAGGLVFVSGCSTVEGLVTGDKIDYRSKSEKTQPLEIPPDLTQLTRDTRYAPQSGTINATTYAQGGGPAVAAVATSTTQPVAPVALGDMRVVREGSQRWLVVPMPADQLWPQLEAFWRERGFNLTVDDPTAGVMETDWAENRAKLPDDILRRTLGRLIDSAYSTGERDKFRTRIERTSAGTTEVYVSHRGLQEVYVSAQRDQTAWTNRPTDPQLEAEFLQRLMAKLNAADDARRTAAAATAPASASAASLAAAAAVPTTTLPARARLVGGNTAQMQVDEGFDRAWRRVGLALDRTGFTVEDRDRAGGLYYVRYVDPKLAGKDEPGFFSKLFSFGKSDDKNTLTGPNRYRIALKPDGDRTTVSVLTSQGAPENGEIGQRIVGLLVEDLK